MRRIYESDALHRDDDPHTPTGTDGSGPRLSVTGNRLSAAVDWPTVSHALVPSWVRDRAVDVRVETDRDVYGPDEPVGIRVRFRNRLPAPIAIRTPTTRRWDWTVDGDRRAQQTDQEPVPDKSALLSFSRSETKIFTRTWHQRFRTADDRWTRATPGTYEIAAFVDVIDPGGRGLSATTNLEITD